MKIDIGKDTKILVFTGPESSGKTTSAERIAMEYQLPLVKEYAREYLTKHGREYTLEDIRNIAKKQVELERQAYQENPLIICDTDIVILEIWALEKYRTSLGIKDELADKKHYLLCYPDIPWEPDSLRENPEDRMRLFERYTHYLRDLNVTVTVLTESDRKELEISF